MQDRGRNEKEEVEEEEEREKDERPIVLLLGGYGKPPRAGLLY
jgi:hypothetical protein